VVFVAVGLWETARPAQPTDQNAGRRWIANFGLFAISEGVRVALGPLLAALAAAASLSPFAQAIPAESFSLTHVALVVVLLDLAFYAIHRLMHAVGWLWRLHAIHHTDLALDVSTTVRHHPLEAVPLAATALGIGALTGATPGEIAAYGVLAFTVQLVAHANVALPAAIVGPLAYVIVTPGFHRLHHSRDAREYNANYGQVFSIWDRLFGTAVMPKESAVTAFGVDDYASPRAQGLGAMLLQPLRRQP
jgi:sterol desaturase/sphingolipid hydroxylase (fatty acid hydroxylase superfamily)